MGCFIGDDIKHFYFKFSVVFISSLPLLLFPYSHAAEGQSRRDPGPLQAQHKSTYTMPVVNGYPTAFITMPFIVAYEK